MVKNAAEEKPIRRVKLVFGAHALGFGPREERFRPEDIYVVGVDDAERNAAIVDVASVLLLTRFVGDPLGFMFGGEEDPEVAEHAQAMVLSLIAEGNETAVSLRENEAEGRVEVTRGRGRVIYARCANDVLSGKFKAPRTSGPTRHFFDRVNAILAEKNLPITHRIEIKGIPETAEDDLSLRRGIVRENALRKVLSLAERIDAVAKEVQSALKNGAEPDPETISASLGLKLTEVRALVTVLTRTDASVAEALRTGRLALSAAVEFASLKKHEQAEQLGALLGAGDADAPVTVIETKAALGAVRKGATPKEAASHARKRRVYLTTHETRSFAKTAQEGGASLEIVDVLRIVVEGPDVLSPDRVWALGLTRAVEALRAAREKTKAESGTLAGEGEVSEEPA